MSSFSGSSLRCLKLASPWEKPASTPASPTALSRYSGEKDLVRFIRATSLTCWESSHTPASTWQCMRWVIVYIHVSWQLTVIYVFECSWPFFFSPIRHWKTTTCTTTVPMMLTLVYSSYLPVALCQAHAGSLPVILWLWSEPACKRKVELLLPG